jgi:hypothetical protein
MHVGRTVCGLPPGNISFGILPPFFIQENSLVHQAVTECFPSIPSNIKRIALFCMASIVYHKEFLRRELQEDHPLFFTPLFANTDRLEQLSDLVECRLQNENDPIIATGIPFNVSFLVTMSKVKHGLDKLVPAIKEVLNDGFERISNEMEQRDVDSGMLTPQRFEQGLQERLDQCMDNARNRTGFRQFLQRFQIPEDEEHRMDEPINAPQHAPESCYHNGRFYRIPPSFNVPCVTLLLAFQLWCYGAELTNSYPLLQMKGSDFSTKNKQKRFGEYKFVMGMMEDGLKSNNTWIDNPSIEQANAMFYEAKDVFASIQTTRTGKRRRISQTSWSTAAKELMKLQLTHSP